MDICRRLEGLPLAIELAAAKLRMLTPAGIAERLKRSLPLLTAAVRDLPDRHRTMRATLDWSVGLLSPQDRDLLEDLGVFAERFSLEAVEAIGAGRSWDGRAIDGITALIDGSLVKQTEVDGRSVLSLLAIVREYALGRLKERGEADLMRAAHADYYTALVRRDAGELRGRSQASMLAALRLELANLRAAVRHLVYTDRLDDAADFAWGLLIYWWIAGALRRRSGVDARAARQGPSRSARTRGRSRGSSRCGARCGSARRREVVAGLGECVRLFTESGDEDAAAMALAARATARVQLPDPDIATADARAAKMRCERLHRLGNGWGEAITARLARPRRRGCVARAMTRSRISSGPARSPTPAATCSRVRWRATRSVALLLARRQGRRGRDGVPCARCCDSVTLHHEEGIAYGLEGMCAVAAAHGEARRAGALSAAAAAIRRRIGVFDVEAFTVHSISLDAVRKTDPEGVAAGELEGAQLTVAEAVRAGPPRRGARGRDGVALALVARRSTPCTAVTSC